MRFLFLSLFLFSVSTTGFLYPSQSSLLRDDGFSDRKSSGAKLCKSLEANCKLREGSIFGSNPREAEKMRQQAVAMERLSSLTKSLEKKGGSHALVTGQNPLKQAPITSSPMKTQKATPAHRRENNSPVLVFDLEL